MSMIVEPIDYLELTRQALRGVMANALSHAAEHGLIDDQHFFITYRTRHSGVVMPDWLRAQYPETITIVIQHEYWDLAVMADRFSIGLSFSDSPVTLVVPFASIKSFADPSVNFQLDIPNSDEDAEGGESLEIEIDTDTDSDAPVADKGDGDGEEDTVVSLDSFRKK